MVITGVPEQTVLDGASTDDEKCRKVFKVIAGEKDPVIPVQLTRLGKPVQGRDRSLLARLTSKSATDALLMDTKALNPAGPNYKKKCT